MGFSAKVSFDYRSTGARWKEGPGIFILVFSDFLESSTGKGLRYLLVITFGIKQRKYRHFERWFYNYRSAMGVLGQG